MSGNVSALTALVASVILVRRAGGLWVVRFVRVLGNDVLLLSLGGRIRGFEWHVRATFGGHYSRRLGRREFGRV